MFLEKGKKFFFFKNYAMSIININFFGAKMRLSLCFFLCWKFWEEVNH